MKGTVQWDSSSRRGLPSLLDSQLFIVWDRPLSGTRCTPVPYSPGACPTLLSQALRAAPTPAARGSRSAPRSRSRALEPRGTPGVVVPTGLQLPADHAARACAVAARPARPGRAGMWALRLPARAGPRGAGTPPPALLVPLCTPLAVSPHPSGRPRGSPQHRGGGPRVHLARLPICLGACMHWCV